MPSFLGDDTSDADILNLDPHTQFSGTNGVAAVHDAKRQTNGVTVSDIHHHHSSSTDINEPYDETSTSSIHDSDVSDSLPVTTNGTDNLTRPTSMSSLPNGKSAYGGYQDHDGVNNAARDGHHKLVNGSATTALPDRTVPRSVNINGLDSDHQRSSQSYLHREELQSTPTRDGSLPHDRSVGGGSLESGVALQPTSPESQTHESGLHQLLTPATPTRDPKSTRGSPHRYSSPPTYQPSMAASNPSLSGHLQNSQAPSSTLKQRHTLEVPKLATGRTSKDGMDTAQASGRFSPTVASPTARRASLSLARRTKSMQGDRDEIVPDEDAQRWAEAYRQKRASKRKRKEEQNDDRVLVGTKVDETHANWVTAYNMLTGIRVSVSRTNAKLDRELNEADFDAKQKSTFDIAGNELVPSAKYDFKFKDYSPWVFRHLRQLFRLDPADYLMSLTGNYILSELGSPGKSGSFFYFSRDYKYIIKTIHHAEHKFLRKILKDYYNHVKENPNTLLSQFYGLHRVKLPYGKKIHFVIMNNIFPAHRDIHTTFDLKGSTVGRDYQEEDLEKNPRATLKDLNWLRRQRHLELGIKKKRMFMEQLQKDVVLLKRLKIMDYSLLIGVHDMGRGNEENLRDKALQVFNPGGEKKSQDDDPQSVLLRTPSKLENARKARELRQMIRAERPVPIGEALEKMANELEESQARQGFVFNQDDGGFRATHEDDTPAEEVYYLGVIDCLTHYGMIKKIEHFWKGLTSDRTQISALPPTQYGDRFFNFVEGITMSAEAAAREAQQKEMEAATIPDERMSRRDTHQIPPMPEHQPPPPPHASRSPEGRELVERASREAWRTEMSEKPVPERTLRTAAAVSGDGRNSMQRDAILPMVAEQDGEYRPRTPAKDMMPLPPPPNRAPPPTPPKTGLPFDTNGTQRLSRESLRNKSLPPLPKQEETGDSGIRMVV